MIFGKRILAAAAAVVCIGTAGSLVQAEDQIGQGISIETAQLCGWEQQKEDTQECWVLFDYRNRNALDQNAGIYFIKSSLASL